MTNIPKRTVLDNELKKNESKKNKILARKSVDDDDFNIEGPKVENILLEKKNVNKNINEINELNSNESENEYMGRKRELSNKKEMDEKKNNKNVSNKILYCFNCSWKFPERMSLIRRNNHINKCYEGKGKLDIMQYNEEQKLKIYRNYPNKKIFELKCCPICGKDISNSNFKSKQNHLHACIRSSLNI